MSNTPHQSVAVLIIGNEVLSGRTREANAWFAAQTLFDVGCKLSEVAIVADVETQIVNTLKRLSQNYDAVITSGGIGPTHDDITMQSIANCFEVPLLEHAATIKVMTDFYGEEALTKGRRRMARLPQGARPILCEHTIAPGAKFKNIYIFAGVPHIFQSQLTSTLDDFRNQQRFIRHEIEVQCAESIFAAALAEIQVQYPDLEIGSYPSTCGNKPCGKICVSGIDETKIEQAIQAIKLMLKEQGKT